MICPNVNVTQPIASVLLPICNAGKHLQKALNSLRQQTFKNFEVIAIDDGSTDSTHRILEQSHDLILKIVHHRRSRGVTNSLISASQAAQGEYFIRQDADDMSHPQRIEQQIAFLKKNPSVVLVGSDYEVINEKGEQLWVERTPQTFTEIRNTLKWRNVFAHGSIIMRRWAYEKIGGYDPYMRCSQDFDLYRRMLKVGQLYGIPEVLYSWRKNSKSINGTMMDLQGAYVSYVWAGKPKYRNKFIRDRRQAWRLHYQGIEQIHMGDDKNAQKSLTRALKRAPENIWTAYHLASLFQRQGLYKKSIQVFRHISKLGSRDLRSGACFHLAEIFLAQNRVEESKKYLLACLNLMPNHRKAYFLSREKFTKKDYHR